MTGEPGESEPTATHRDVLAYAVASIGGQERPGQVEMADAIASTFSSGRHLLVQAGTGTGKSLGYLAPALVRLAQHPGERIVVATATLALQSQLANADIPAALDAVEAVLGERPRHAILKGRTNYACLLKVRDSTAADQGALISAGDLAETIKAAPLSTPESALGAEVLALREWAEEQAEAGGLADRDDAPSHTERAWQQVSIPVRECLTPQRCPYGDACFVEQSRDEARAADLIVTNHALLAIDAMHGGTALPEHQAVIIDEAHELVARVTGAASAELTPALVERVARRALSYLEDRTPWRCWSPPTPCAGRWRRPRWNASPTPTHRSSPHAPPCGTRPGPRSARCPRVRRRGTRTGDRWPRRCGRSSTSPSGWRPWSIRMLSGSPTGRGSAARPGSPRCRSPG